MVGLTLAVVTLPLIDAAPLQMRSPVARGLSIVISIMFALNYLAAKLRVKEIHSQEDSVPEIGVSGLATASVYNLGQKAQLAVCNLAGIMAVRAWRHPREALMLSHSPLLVDLHNIHQSLDFGNDQAVPVPAWGHMDIRPS